jgi:hypothetical protein
MPRQLTIDEAIKELVKRHRSDMGNLESPTWRANHASKYSYTIGHADALDEIITMLETSYC